jgi:hypothetical protein
LLFFSVFSIFFCIFLPFLTSTLFLFPSYTIFSFYELLFFVFFSLSSHSFFTRFFCHVPLSYSFYIPCFSLLITNGCSWRGKGETESLASGVYTGPGLALGYALLPSAYLVGFFPEIKIAGRKLTIPVHEGKNVKFTL